MLISSGDRDAFQLVSDAARCSTRTGCLRDRPDGPAAVEEKYGVTPRLYPDLAALVGEQSDNLPGVPGVGPKTAAKWLNQYGALNDVVDRVNQIKGKAGDSLREHLADVIRNRQINELVRDLTLDVAVDDLVRRRGTGTRCTSSSTAWSSACCASGWSRARARRDRRPRVRAGGRPLKPGEVAGWLGEHVTPVSGSACRCRAAGARHRRDHRLALANTSGAAAWFDPID